MVDFIKVEHEFIFTDEDIPTLKPQEKDCLYVVTEDGNPLHWHIVRLNDTNSINWLSHYESFPNNLNLSWIYSRRREYVRKTAEDCPARSCTKRTGSFHCRNVPIKMILNGILTFNQGQPQVLLEEEEKLPSRFKAIMMELSRE